MYYWAIKWKSYAVEDLYVNDAQKEAIEREWIKETKDRKHQTFTLNKETYSFSSIDSITKTNKRIESVTKLLYAAEAALNSNAPLIDDDGDVVTHWYKKLVSIREFENFYAKHHAYYLIDKADGGVWVGMRLVEKENGNRSDQVELCTREESDKLWKYQSLNS